MTNLIASNTHQQSYPYTQHMTPFEIEHPYALELTHGKNHRNS